MNQNQAMEFEAGPADPESPEADVMPTVEDIDKSSSDLEEGEEVDDAAQEQYHSDVSSESDMEEKNVAREQVANEAHSDASSRSDGSQSSSSKSGKKCMRLSCNYLPPHR